MQNAPSAQAAGTAGTAPACRYPGCGNQARPRAGDGPGAPPRYCGLTVAEDRGEAGIVQVTHGPLTAYRRREDLAGRSAAPGTQPVTTALTRAAAIRDDAIAAITRLTGQLETVPGQLAAVAAQLSAASPEAAEAQVEAARAEASADTQAARAELARQVTLTQAALDGETEARAAATQAITAMETAGKQRADAETRAEAARAAAADTLRQAREEIHAAQAAAEQAVTAARQAAAQAQATAQAEITAARRERDTAIAEAAAANAAAQAARDTAAQLRDDHQRHANALQAAHQAQITALTSTITALSDRLAGHDAATAAPGGQPARSQPGRRKPAG